MEFGFAGHQSYDNSQPQGSAPYVLLVDGARGISSRAGAGGAAVPGICGCDAGFAALARDAHCFGGRESFERADDASERARGDSGALQRQHDAEPADDVHGAGGLSRVQYAGGGVCAGHVDDQSALYCDGGSADGLGPVGAIGDGGAAGFAELDALRSSPLGSGQAGQAVCGEDREVFDWLGDVRHSAESFGDWADGGPAAGGHVVRHDGEGGVGAGDEPVCVGPGGLRQPYFDITSAGWQQRFGEKTIVSVELLARNQHHGLVFETETPGQIGSEFLLESTRRDKYRGATVSARHSFGGAAEVFGSYTRSRANTDQVLDPVLGALYFAAQQGGPLSWDAPNRFLGWASVPTPVWGILFSCLLEYRTGYPFSVGEPAAVFDRGGEFAAVSGLCELEYRAGEEVSVSGIFVCGARVGDQFVGAGRIRTWW